MKSEPQMANGAPDITTQTQSETPTKSKHSVMQLVTLVLSIAAAVLSVAAMLLAFDVRFELNRFYCSCFVRFRDEREEGLAEYCG